MRPWALGLTLAGACSFLLAESQTRLSRSPDASEASPDSYRPGIVPAVEIQTSATQTRENAGADTAAALHWVSLTGQAPLRGMPVAENASGPRIETSAERRRWLQGLRELAADSKGSVVDLVTAAIESKPDAACEVVKTVIEATHAEPRMVAVILEAAIMANPDQMRQTAQCALAAAPDSLSEVQAVLSRLDPAGRSPFGDSKDAKDAKLALPEVAGIVSNPLDLPPKPPPPIPIPPPPPPATDTEFIRSRAF
ncbi:hypothetical protein llg_08050 [Luteolibacter sp. LG18]|nr:hypothetical protein llg_08050 [Luteolibacter sp. LG18]